MAGVISILDFRLEQFYPFLIYKSPWCFLPSFQSTGLLVQEIERKKKIDFQHGGYGDYLWFQIGTFLCICDLQITPILPIKFRVSWPFRSGEEVQNRFSRWRLWRPSWISDRNKLSYFWSTYHPDTSYRVSSHLAFRFRRRFKIDFQDGSRGIHLGFPITTVLAILDLQVAPILPTKFRVSWSFRSWEEVQNGFTRWPAIFDFRWLRFYLFLICKSPWYCLPSFESNWPFCSAEETQNRFSRWPSGIFDRSDFNCFWSTSSRPILPTKFRVNWPFGSGEAIQNRFSKWRLWPLLVLA